MSPVQKINIANIALLFLSALAASIHPLATFLFAYAVLGPLHYLTEIPWLHQRQYFTKHIHRAWPLYIIGVLYLALPLDNAGFSYVVALAFLWAIAIQVTSSWIGQIAMTVAGLSILWWSGMPPLLIAIFGIFLTTLIHVGVFTWLFMLSGVTKKPEWSGIATLILLPLLALVLLLPLPSILPDAVLQSMYTSFISINGTLLGTTSLDTIFNSESGLAVLRVIAFLYTYHYLNWFSKTGVIGWHKLPRTSLILILGLWVASILLYILDYTSGLKALLFLSIVHVFLEFPLNIQTMRHLGHLFIPTTKVDKTKK